MTNVTAAVEARCPLCDRLIERPMTMEPQRFSDFEFGTCECGAVYVHDITGHNLGAAFIEALGCACNDNWDMVFELTSGEDYQDVLLEGYDIESNLIEPTGRTKEGKRVKGVLTFIRLAEDLRELTQDEMSRRFAARKKVRELQRTADERFSIGKDFKGPLISIRYSKQEITNFVNELRLEALSTMAIRDPLVIRKIQRLLYAADIHLRWKAVLSLGAVVGRLVDERPAIAGNMVRTLLYACNDSAATNWGAIETLGEIIRIKPAIYGSFVRHLLGLLDDPPSRPAIFWAIGRIGAEHQKLIKSNAFFSIFNFLKDSDPNVRGHAVWALGRIKALESVSAIEKMVRDEGELTFFDGEKLIKTTVGRLAEEAILHIKNLNRGDMNMSETIGKDEVSSDAVAIYMEGVRLMNQGMSLDALLKFEKALALFEDLGSNREIANTCEKLADLHVQRGNFKSAISLYQRAMAICEKGGDDIGKVILAEKIIDLYRANKEFEKALPYLLFTLELVEDMGDASRAGYYLTAIGDIYQRQGKIEDALDAYRLARKIYQGMGAREQVKVLEKGITTLEAREKGQWTS
ncbi:MAG: DVU0298 family protein [Dissulfurimicrobium sp.]|uniref:DVU0298 family protein n=1 Tax=Dissulfurimicrobium sp. TaxID=2022436 RepID=UPI004049E58F